MRIAHLIMAHKNPDQLLMLVESLQHPNFDIYLHVDKKVDLTTFKDIGGNVNIIRNRTVCNWGGNSFLNAITHSLHEILATGKNYDFINLLSGQDYPLKSSEYIYNFFESKKGINFISYDDTSVSEWWKQANARYEQYHFTDFTVRGRYLLQAVLNTIAPRRKFPIPVDLYGGSNSTWWTISGECAKYLDDKFYTNLKLRQFLKYTWSPDEFIIASLIMNSEFKNRVLNNNLRYIDWSEQKAHPKILVMEDLPSLTNSDMLFARKFDTTICKQILTVLHNRRKKSSN
ncbi:beta-1,6-N-acetylglucosaminyltransferase [Pedobacter sp. V48]|uniref:beta-1,6-N-acetylglucosaminyltransferase n=1 Tax=Pedobacter sp. V48 TaxID=509635 RepID=UPI0003E45AF7|nr:beta-1,6-N-acetylglucosaminyltransferase [Pedobacter sp. V48]ETZ22612.1 hypothetical protein N824_22320 [Pedobacter sp. V48]